MAKRVSIINFKGGVGKTTLAFNLAAGLAKLHEARVLLVDMDHQSSLSILCLGTDEWEKAAQSRKTVTNVFRCFCNAEVPDFEIVHHTSFGDYEIYAELIDIAPAYLDLDDVEIELTSSHQGNAIYSEWNKRTLICQWLEEEGLDEEYDYIIFDCAPATKIVSQNAIAASHGYIVPVVPEAVMERGAPHLCNMVQSGIDQKLSALANLPDTDDRAMFVAESRLVGIVVTRIQTAGNAWSGYTNDHTQHLDSLSRTWQDDLIKPYIKSGAGIGETLSQRVPVYDHQNSQNIGRRQIHKQFEELTSNLKSRIDGL